MDQILKEEHSNKTKQMTNWSISTFKGEVKFFLFQIVKYIYLQLFLEIVKLPEKLSAKVIKITSNYRCSDNSPPLWFPS